MYNAGVCDLDVPAFTQGRAPVSVLLNLYMSGKTWYNQGNVSQFSGSTAWAVIHSGLNV